jgi:hypothetical protein
VCLGPLWCWPPRRQREESIYLTFIIDHYDRLPAVVVFCHPHRHAWHIAVCDVFVSLLGGGGRGVPGQLQAVLFGLDGPVLCRHATVAGDVQCGQCRRLTNAWLLLHPYRTVPLTRPVVLLLLLLLLLGLISVAAGVLLYLQLSVALPPSYGRRCVCVCVCVYVCVRAPIPRLCAPGHARHAAGATAV